MEISSCQCHWHEGSVIVARWKAIFFSIGSCTDFKSKWLISGGFFSNYSSSECGGHVLEQNDNFTESDWSKKSTWPSMFTTIFILSAENRVDCSTLWIDEIPNWELHIFEISNQSGWHLVDFFRTTIAVNVKVLETRNVLEKNCDVILLIKRRHLCCIWYI